MPIDGVRRQRARGRGRRRERGHAGRGAQGRESREIDGVENIGEVDGAGHQLAPLAPAVRLRPDDLLAVELVPLLRAAECGQTVAIRAVRVHAYGGCSQGSIIRVVNRLQLT